LPCPNGSILKLANLGYKLSTCDPDVMPKLLRAIRLDASDTYVFARAAAAGEWVVSGAFMFWDKDLLALQGQAKQAFRAGFLGLGSFGWSTLAVVVEATSEERAFAVASLAAYLQTEHGAPSLEAAHAAAEDELAFAESLAGHAVQTLVAVHRTVTTSGEISEQFRTFHTADAKQAAAMPCSVGAFSVVEDEHDAGAADFDLAGTIAAQQLNRVAKS
jgi:hypothetical protein